ncbi:MAG: response regulator, partial [Cephaloticoccus sp.]|nr:response regulator [Cephaloticoccus sp.]
MNEPSSRKVLIIDDESQIRRLLRLTLASGGYTVLEAETGQLGLQEAAARQPEGIILDLGLPDMSGVEVLRRLREWSRVPVLILSVRDNEDDKIEALDAGADDYLTKPF